MHYVLNWCTCCILLFLIFLGCLFTAGDCQWKLAFQLIRVHFHLLKCFLTLFLLSSEFIFVISLLFIFYINIITLFWTSQRTWVCGTSFESEQKSCRSTSELLKSRGLWINQKDFIHHWCEEVPPPMLKCNLHPWSIDSDTEIWKGTDKGNDKQQRARGRTQTSVQH